jgi:hypothetical protein
MAAVPSVDPSAKRRRVAMLEEQAPAETLAQDGSEWTQIGPDHFVRRHA